MALQIAERAVVADDVEAVRGPLERPARPVAPVAPAPRRRRRGGRTLLRRRARRPGGSARSSGRSTWRSSRWRPAPCPRRPGRSRSVSPRAPARRGLRPQVPTTIGRRRLPGPARYPPRPPAVLPVHPGEERRDHLTQLVEHHLGVACAPRAAGRPASAAAAARRSGPYRTCRRWTATPPAAGPAARQGTGPDGPPIGEVGHAGLLPGSAADEALQDRQQLTVGVEHPVHLADVAGAEGRLEDRQGSRK